MAIVNIIAILKQFYFGPVVDQINTESLAWNFFQKTTVQMAGKQFVVPFHTGRNGSVGFAYEGENLGTPGQNQYEQIYANWGYLYGQVSMSGPEIRMAATSAGAFQTAVQSQMDPLVENARHMSDICAFTGGAIAGFVINKIDGSTPTYQWAGRAGDEAWGRQGFPAGATVAFYRTDTWTQVGATRTLVAITAATDIAPPSITISGAIDLTGLAANIPVVAAIGAASLGAESVGIIGNLAGPSFFSLTRGTAGTKTLDSTIMYANPTSGVYDEPNPNTWTNLAAKIKYLSGMTPDFWFINTLQISAYSTELQGVASGLGTSFRQDVKTAPATGDMGFTDFAWAGKSFEQAQDCPYGVVAFLSRKHWKVSELGPAEFDTSTGSEYRAVPGQDVVTALYKHYYQTFTDRPNASGLLIGVSNPT